MGRLVGFDRRLKDLMNGLCFRNWEVNDIVVWGERFLSVYWEIVLK